MKTDINFILIISLALIISSIVFGLIGMKNSDLSCNMLILNDKYNLNLQGDRGLDGTVRSFDSWYIIGLNQIYISLMLSIASFMFLFGYILVKHYKEIK